MHAVLNFDVSLACACCVERVSACAVSLKVGLLIN